MILGRIMSYREQQQEQKRLRNEFLWIVAVIIAASLFLGWATKNVGWIP